MRGYVSIDIETTVEKMLVIMHQKMLMMLYMLLEINQVYCNCSLTSPCVVTQGLLWGFSE